MPIALHLCAVVIALALPLAGRAQPSGLPNGASAPIRLIIQHEKDLGSTLSEHSALIVGLLSGLGTLVTAFFQRRWHRKERIEESKRHEKERARAHARARQERQSMLDRADRDRQFAHALDSLEWFESGSQKRSIGIAVVEGHWDQFPALHRTWSAVLANQAVYLLGESGQKDAAHEMDNLARIRRLLARQRELLSDDQKRAILAALDRNAKGAGLRDISPDELNDWRSLASTDI